MGGSYDGPLSCGSAGLGSIEGRYNDSGWPTPVVLKALHDPLSLQPPCGRGSARPVAQSRQRAAVFRLPAVVRPAAARGKAIGDQPDLPALPRGRAHRPQACGLAAKLWGPVPRSWSRRGPTRAGRWTSSTTSSPKAGASASLNMSTTSPRNAWVRFRRRRSRGRARGPRTGGNRRATRQARNDRVRPWHRVHLQRHAAAQKSSWMSLSRSPIWMRRPG